MSSQGSNIQSVDLNENGSVTIHGTVTGVDASCKVTLLHIWLAQPGVGKEGGVGLAIDALDKNTRDHEGKEALKPADRDGCASFSVKSLGVGGSAATSASASAGDGKTHAQFRPGPAVVSVIAVVSPIDSGGRPAEVLEWDRMLTLPKRGHTEAGDAIEPSSSS
jgi:hypothetical protein